MLAHPIDAAFLASAQQASSPQHLLSHVELMGGLAFWMLQPEALSAVLLELKSPIQQKLSQAWSDPAACLPDQVGSCVALFVCRSLQIEPVTSDALATQLLREAFLLPLQWKQDVPHSPFLPPHLIEIAELAKSSVLTSEISASWGLVPDKSWEMIDLSKMVEWRCDSAWASLAASLLLAQDNLRPQRGIFASVAWEPGMGIRAVEGLSAKCQVARTFGARRLFVAGGGLQPELSDIRDGEDILAVLPPAESRGRHALLPLLQALQHKPGLEASFQERCLYANRFTREQRVAREAYISEFITAELVNRQQDRPGKADALIVTVSNRSGAFLSILAANPERCLLLYTDRDSKETVPSLIGDLLRAGFVGNVVGQEVHPTDFGMIRRLVRAFVNAGDESERVWVDCTGGKSGMKGALLMETFSHPNVGLFYVDSMNGRDNPFHEVGTETLYWLRRPGQRDDEWESAKETEVESGQVEWKVWLPSSEAAYMP